MGPVCVDTYPACQGRSLEATLTNILKANPALVLDIGGHCPQCGKAWNVKIPRIEAQTYLQGVHIQRAMPSLPPADRELLLSGMCEPCWNQMFEEMEEYNETVGNSTRSGPEDTSPF
jgi:hypothetical protein